MAGTVNQSSANSILQDPSKSNVPNDGTGQCISTLAALYADSRTGVLQLDPWLEPFTDTLKRRYSKAQQWIATLDAHEGGLETFSRVRLTVHSHVQY